MRYTNLRLLTYLLTLPLTFTFNFMLHANTRGAKFKMCAT